ncbi:hypothetical protein BH23BAC1_BH23BAC1_44470 [soil metagenome]
MVRFNDRQVPVITRIEKIYSRIDNVKDLSYKINNQHRYDYYEYMNMLTQKRIQLENKLEELKHSSANTYDEIKEDVEIKLAELSLDLMQIRDRFYQ